MWLKALITLAPGASEATTSLDVRSPKSNSLTVGGSYTLPIAFRCADGECFLTRAASTPGRPSRPPSPRGCQHDERRLSSLRACSRFGAGAEFCDHLAEGVRTAAVADYHVPARSEEEPGDRLAQGLLPLLLVFRRLMSCRFPLDVIAGRVWRVRYVCASAELLTAFRSGDGSPRTDTVPSRHQIRGRRVLRSRLPGLGYGNATMFHAPWRRPSHLAHGQ